MKLNTITGAKGSKQTKTRVGRGIGSGLGKTCGKGHKGQKARAGGYNKRGFEGGQMPLQMRLPKFGFKSRLGFKTQQLRITDLAKLTDADLNNVTLDVLKANKLVKQNMNFVKIIANGEFTQKVVITTKHKDLENIKISKGARALIEQAKGKIV